MNNNAADAGGGLPSIPTVLPNPEVSEKAKPRTFAPSYKKDILAQLDGLDREEQAALMRQEGLYSTLIRKWRMQAARDAGQTVQPKRRRKKRPGPVADPDARELAKMKRENERLKKELETSRRINDVQAKLCALLDDLSKSATTDPKQTS